MRPNRSRPLGLGRRQGALGTKAAAHLGEDRRMVEEVEVVGAAQVVVVLDREAHALAAALGRPGARLEHQQIADDPADLERTTFDGMTAAEVVAQQRVRERSSR